MDETGGISMIAHYNQYEIEVFDDESYDINSNGNPNRYQYLIRSAKDIYQPSAKHGIRVRENGVECASAIICASGGATGIYDNSFLIKEDLLFICCTDHVYALQIPSLQLIWKCNADWATCFSVHEFDGDLIVYGETTISRITTDGNIKWQFGGADIFVLPDNRAEPFKIEGNEILLNDWEGNHYRLNGDGQQVG